MKVSLLLLALSVSAAVTAKEEAAQDGVTLNDETLIDRQSKDIDFPGCYSDLAKADRNGDGFVKQNEFLNFVQEYGKRRCFSTDKLTLQQYSVFNTVSCFCTDVPGNDDDCCVKDNAKIPTAGALVPESDRTPSQKTILTSACKLTDATISGQCPPVVREREPGPGALVDLSGNGSGLSDAALWGIIAAAILLFLLCCCCCCVLRRRKQKEEEEEVEEENVENVTKEMPMEQAPPMPIGPHLLRKTGIDMAETPKDIPDEEMQDSPLGPALAASGAAAAEDSDEEEEGRKKRGGGHIPGEEENEGLRIPTAPRLPPPEDPEAPPINLRPIPPKEHDDEEWDQPGRNIDFPKDSDEMSGQELDHYVPDGGVNIPEREGKDPVTWKSQWNRQKPEEPDEVDLRKHRIQSGLGDQEVWNKLDNEETTERSKAAPSGDVFDWVVQSALGVLDKNDNNPAGNNNNTAAPIKQGSGHDLV